MTALSLFSSLVGGAAAEVFVIRDSTRSTTLLPRLTHDADVIIDVRKI